MYFINIYLTLLNIISIKTTLIVVLLDAGWENED